MKAVITIIISVIVLYSCNNREPQPLKSEAIEEIQIGNLVWMKGNLDVEYFQNGDWIPEISDDSEWQKAKTPAWCFANNDSGGHAKLGRIYNYYAITDQRGLLPAGWHIATADDWDSLRNCIANQEDSVVMNSLFTEIDADTVSTEKNYLGAQFFQCNSRKPEGLFLQEKGFLHFWVNPQSTGLGNHIILKLGNHLIDFNRKSKPLNSGFSVRCVKDKSK